LAFDPIIPDEEQIHNLTQLRNQIRDDASPSVPSYRSPERVSVHTYHSDESDQNSFYDAGFGDQEHGPFEEVFPRDDYEPQEDNWSHDYISDIGNNYQQYRHQNVNQYFYRDQPLFAGMAD